jgi:hypothetical protein
MKKFGIYAKAVRLICRLPRFASSQPVASTVSTLSTSSTSPFSISDHRLLKIQRLTFRRFGVRLALSEVAGRRNAEDLAH